MISVLKVSTIIIFTITDLAVILAILSVSTEKLSLFYMYLAKYFT